MARVARQGMKEIILNKSESGGYPLCIHIMGESYRLIFLPYFSAVGQIVICAGQQKSVEVSSSEVSAVSPLCSGPTQRLSLSAVPQP